MNAAALFSLGTVFEAAMVGAGSYRRSSTRPFGFQAARRAGPTHVRSDYPDYKKIVVSYGCAM